jgi:hypothetical protein
VDALADGGDGRPDLQGQSCWTWSAGDMDARVERCLPVDDRREEETEGNQKPTDAEHAALCPAK